MTLPRSTTSPAVPAADKPADAQHAPADRRLWWLVTAYVIALLVGTHIPAENPTIAELVAHDKLLHFTAYAVLAALAVRGLTPRGGRLRLATGVAVWLGVVGLGAMDELTQPYFNRSCDVADWIADALGAALAIAAYAKWTRFRRG